MSDKLILSFGKGIIIFTALYLTAQIIRAIIS